VAVIIYVINNYSNHKIGPSLVFYYVWSLPNFRVGNYKRQTNYN